MTTLDLHPITGGRFEATCGKCLRRSAALSSGDPEIALAELLALGWSMYQAKTGRRAYPLCVACTKDPPDVDKEAAAALTRRKRK
jgi:hypothetical protein